MKIVFMGTPEFAAIALRELVKRHEVTAVITQPDKPSGRGKKLMFPPVKAVATENDIAVYQPLRIKEKNFVETLKSIPADIFVVAAYGQILSKEILDMPKYGAVNIHASLLPKYRGAAPIQWAIINGEQVSGITIMQMDEGLDTGPMLLHRSTILDNMETGASLHDKLADIGSTAILDALELIEAGRAVKLTQDNEGSSYAPMLTKETGRIDWQNDSTKIERLVRGLYPWPSAHTNLEGYGVVKVLAASLVSAHNAVNAVPGTIIDVDKKRGLLTACGDGAKAQALMIEKIQVSGKKAMDVPAFLLGNDIGKDLRFY